MDEGRRQRALQELGTREQFATDRVTLGPWTSYSMMHDPKHVGFVLGRYKFVAKMLEGKRRVLEVGCGDGVGIPIVAQAVGALLAVDWEPRLVDDNRSRLQFVRNAEHRVLDFVKEPSAERFDAIFSVDVIEHLEPPMEQAFMEHTVAALVDDGICIIGTPNITASAYATERSAVQHINLKGHAELRALMARHFANVFLFSMNDEVVHTGFSPMAHYLLAMGVGKRQRSGA